jgi:uncharacterized protein YhbP (UPF0306 family)
LPLDTGYIIKQEKGLHEIGFVPHFSFSDLSRARRAHAPPLRAQSEMDARIMALKHAQLVARLLQQQSTLALATTSADGTPHIAPLFYLAGDALRLFWFSSAASRHSRNLKRDPAAAVTVYRPTRQWREIRGVQLRGTVSVVRDPARRSAMAAAYSARFQLGTAFKAVQARSRLYEFQPSWIRYLDNSIRFGYKFEFSPPLPTGLGAGAAGAGTVAIRSRRG